MGYIFKIKFTQNKSRQIKVARILKNVLITIFKNIWTDKYFMLIFETDDNNKK